MWKTISTYKLTNWLLGSHHMYWTLDGNHMWAASTHINLPCSTSKLIDGINQYCKKYDIEELQIYEFYENYGYSPDWPDFYRYIETEELGCRVLKLRWLGDEDYWLVIEDVETARSIQKESEYNILVKWSPPGEISKEGCWVGFESCYLYTGDTIEALMGQMGHDWQDDRHLIG